MTFLQPDYQLRTFSKMDEYPEFCLGELAASEDKAFERSFECCAADCLVCISMQHSRKHADVVG